jgi:curved DNA-binding protein CbpA
MDTNINLYKILGISSSSSQSDVKSSYKKLAKIYHPDVNKTGDENSSADMIIVGGNILAGVNYQLMDIKLNL